MLAGFPGTALLFAACSSIVAAIAIWLILKTPAVNLFRDRPGTRKVHQTQTARGGGVGIIVAAVAGLLVWQALVPASFDLPHSNLFRALIYAAVCIGIVGLVDDMSICSISNGAKFLLEVVVASVVVFMAGIRLDTVSLFGHVYDVGIWGSIFSVLWIVGVTNALNLIDGIDCLAGSIALSIFATIALIALPSGSLDVVLICAICMGAIAGFLVFNWPPARVFLGDTGSLFLGTFIGILSIYLVQHPYQRQSVLLLPLIAGLPILDVFAAMTRRYFKQVLAGKPWYRSFGAMFQPDNEHMHHRLVYRGLTHLQAVAILFALAATLNVTALIVANITVLETYVILGYLVFLVFVVLYELNFLDRIAGIVESSFGRRRKKTATVRIVVAVTDADSVLTHAIMHYEQEQFSFCFVDRSVTEQNSTYFDALIIGNRDASALKTDWLFAQQLSRRRRCPVLVITDSEQTPYSAPQQFRANADPNDGAALVVFVKRPVYIPVLLKRIETILKSNSFASMFEMLVRETKKISLALIRNEHTRQK